LRSADTEPETRAFRGDSSRVARSSRRAISAVRFGAPDPGRFSPCKFVSWFRESPQNQIGSLNTARTAVESTSPRHAYSNSAPLMDAS